MTISKYLLCPSKLCFPLHVNANDGTIWETSCCKTVLSLARTSNQLSPFVSIVEPPVITLRLHKVILPFYSTRNILNCNSLFWVCRASPEVDLLWWLSRTSLCNISMPLRQKQGKRTSYLGETFLERWGFFHEQLITAFAGQISIALHLYFNITLQFAVFVSAYKPRVGKVCHSCSVLASWGEPVIAWFAIIGA